MSSNFKRCSLCDYSNVESKGKSEDREFVLDKSTSEYHCTECANAIQEAVFEQEWSGKEWNGSHIDAYWKRTASREKGQFMPADPEKARRGGLQARKFPGYTPTGGSYEGTVRSNLGLLDPIQRWGAPSDRDLDQIEAEWEAILMELDLNDGQIEEVD